jgi:hypothetical protein
MAIFLVETVLRVSCSPLGLILVDVAYSELVKAGQ